MDEGCVLLIEPDTEIRRPLADVARRAGIPVVEEESLARVVARFSAVPLSEDYAATRVAVFDPDTAAGDDELLSELFALACPTFRLIVHTAGEDLSAAIRCLSRGAYDILQRPAHPEEFLRIVTLARAAALRAAAEAPTHLKVNRPVSDWLELTAGSELEELHRLQRFIDLLLAPRVSKEVIVDLRMGLEELGRNAIEWGNRFDPSKRVRVSCCLFEDRVVFRIADEGEGFRPKDIPDPLADPQAHVQNRADAGKRPGGYGLFMVRGLMDEVVHSERGNIVLMTKYLTPAARAGQASSHA